MNGSQNGRSSAPIGMLPLSGTSQTLRGRVLRMRPAMTGREVRSVRRADALIAAGQKAKALAHLKRLVKQMPEAVSGYLRLASLLRDACRAAEAVEVLRTAVEQAPRDPDPREALADIYLEMGRWDSAIDEANVLLALSPRSLFARDVLSAAFLQRGLVDQALRVTDEMILLDPTDPANHFKRGVLLHQKGNVAAAIRSFLRVLQMQPDADVAEESRVAVEMLDTFQLRQIVTLAVEDVPFRLRLQRDGNDALAERGYFLSERGVATLMQMSFENLPSGPPGWRQYVYH
ncbi:MAG: tetratricopeptide repeat protein [Capsulimonadales bacterium]|nr:tetratricopeptide repeat protein [Capsulimonadales bacterium]